MVATSMRSIKTDVIVNSFRFCGVGARGERVDLSDMHTPLCHLMNAEVDEAVDYSSDEEDEVEL